METYKEYPIRCKTCNEQLACHANDYEALLDSGVTVEEALNQLGIDDYCSRISMMTPTIVPFNMENREVIEGFKSVDAAKEVDAQNESISRPVFNPCMGLQPGLPQVNPTRPIVTTPLAVEPQTRTQPNVPGQLIQPNLQPNLQQNLQPNVQPLRLTQLPPVRTQPIIQMQTGFTPLLQNPTINTALPAMAPTIRTNVPTLGLLTGTRPLPTVINTPPVLNPIIPEATIVPPILPPDFDGDTEAFGIGIPVPDNENVGKERFRDPVLVGVPTINPDPLIPLPTVYVGAGKHCQILNGRTYLAQ